MEQKQFQSQISDEGNNEKRQGINFPESGSSLCVSESLTRERYEYKVLPVVPGCVENAVGMIESSLCILGLDGWQIVSSVHGGLALVLSRIKLD